MTSNSIEIINQQFLTDVLAGLGSSSKSIPCKYFYDKAGSLFFEQICELPEYYPTRTETGIIRQNVGEMAAQLGESVLLIEFGSGSSVKTEWLLQELVRPAGYVPIDISRKHLNDVAEELRAKFPEIEVLPVVGDFTKNFDVPQPTTPASHSAVFFPGSTIGNFERDKAESLLHRINSQLGPEGGLLIGIDLQKDPGVIQAAYDDAAGVTAKFNLNLLHRINRELGADFVVDQFEHLAVYDEDEGRVEIFIVSQTDQIVTIDGREFQFEAGEKILTEYSHKYTIDGFAKIAKAAGFSLHKCWTDEKQWFAMLHFVSDNH